MCCAASSACDLPQMGTHPPVAGVCTVLHGVQYMSVVHDKLYMSACKAQGAHKHNQMSTAAVGLYSLEACGKLPEEV